MFEPASGGMMLYYLVSCLPAVTTTGLSPTAAYYFAVLVEAERCSADDKTKRKFDPNF